MNENGTRGFENSIGTESSVIWTGSLELHQKHAAEIIRSQRQVSCQISSRIINGEPEIDSKGWPQILAMQFIPKTFVGSLGGNYFEHAPSVVFSFQPCDTFNHIKQTMETGGLAGCVHFAGTNTPTNCPIKVLLLLYSKERKAFIGFIPTDQENFIVRLREIIQQHKRQGESHLAERAKGVVRSGPQFSPIGMEANGRMQDEVMVDVNGNPNLQEQQQQHQPHQIQSGEGSDTNMVQPQQQTSMQSNSYGSLSFLIPSATSFSPFSNYERASKRNCTPSEATATNSSSQISYNSTVIAEMEVPTETDLKSFISNIMAQQEEKNSARHVEVMNSTKNFRDIITNLTKLADRQRDTIHCLTIENQRLRAQLYGNNNNSYNSSSPSNNNNNNINNQGVFQSPSSRLNPTGQRNQQQRSQVSNSDAVLNDLL